MSTAPGRKASRAKAIGVQDPKQARQYTQQEQMY
jgi:hypothetical protein